LRNCVRSMERREARCKSAEMPTLCRLTDTMPYEAR
jgi:hypothetical protein